MPSLASIPLKINAKNIDLGGATLDVAASSDADAFAAIASDQPFPDRDFEIGRVALNAAKDVEATVGVATKITFGLSAEVAASIGAFASGADVLRALAITDAETIGLRFAGKHDQRFLVMRSGYAVNGEVSGTHPLGALGAVTFGVESKKKSVFAVVQAFDKNKGSRTVLQDSVDSWRVPRTVRLAEDIAPGTWIIAEVDGSIVANLATQVGYDFTFVRELKGALKGDIGLKIDLGLKAMVGFEVSGRYVLVLERASLKSGTELRCRLFKVSKKGWQFGLNLTAGVKGVIDALPKNADDLVAAVFGVHGLQVVKDLQVLEKWTDPVNDLSDMVAGLTTDAAFKLMHTTTGVDPKTHFDKARATLLDVVKRWNELPSQVSAAMWKLLEDETGFTQAHKDELLAELQLLADPEPETVRAQLERLIAKVGFEGTPVGKVLVALGERGVMALIEDVPQVSNVARQIRALLDGTVLQTLHDELTEALRLDTILKVVTETEFDDLNGLLVARLSAFLDREFKFEELDEIKDAIHRVLRARQEIYDQARQALSRRYEFALAYSYQKASARTALIDVTFDTAEPQAAAAMRELLEDSNFDALFVTATPGVELRKGVLTHEITRKSTLSVTMPFYNSKTETLGKSLASVRAATDGERVLFYELDAESVTTRQNRFRSQLSATAALALPLEHARVYSAPTASLSYRYAHAQVNMRRRDVEHLVAPFVTEYFHDQFGAGGQSSFDTWLTDLDRRVEEEVENGTNEFGDVLLALEVLAPPAALQAWFVPRTDEQARQAAQQVSRRLQASLKALLSFNHFRRLENVRQNAIAAPLLVYAAIPPRTNAVLSDGQLTFDTGDSVYWNWPDLTLRRAMVRNAQTRGQLQVQLARFRERLLAAGFAEEAKFFAPGESQDFEQLALAGGGEERLKALLFTEAVMVTGAAKALEKISEFMRQSALTPTAALEELSKFGDLITKTFQERVTEYGKDILRPLGAMLFLEAARALSPSISGHPSALLAMTVLRERRTFIAERFLVGEIPDTEDVAVEQRIMTA